MALCGWRPILARQRRALSQPATGRKDEVVYEGALHQGSSLLFYLNRKFFLLNPPADDDSFVGSDPGGLVLNEDALIEKWATANGLYLIVRQSRLDYWRKLLMERFHIFHQVATCGPYVILSNQL